MSEANEIKHITEKKLLLEIELLKVELELVKKDIEILKTYMLPTDTSFTVPKPPKVSHVLRNVNTPPTNLRRDYS
jgi:hypothetical protein